MPSPLRLPCRVCAKGFSPVARRRLFFAFWPNDRQRETLREVIRPALSSVEGVASERRNWHVTLVFIGDFDEQRIPALQQAVADITFEPFRLRLDRLSYWPRPKIACLEATRIPDDLVALEAQVSEAVRRFDIPPEQHRYRPHITIARNVRSFASERLARPLQLTCTEFSLIESIRNPRGVQYHPLKQ